MPAESTFDDNPASREIVPDLTAPPRYESELHTDHLLDNIGDRAVRGGALVMAAQAIKAALQFGAVVVLVRLLPPAAFGLVAMTAALGAILDPIRELGFSSATIQQPNLTHAQASTLFWINAGAGIVVGMGLAAAAPAIAAFYQQPDLLAITRWLAAGFLLSGFGVQHWALLRRQMRFGAVAGLDSTAEVTGFVVAVILALKGAGYWALVAQRLIPGVLTLIGSWTLCRWRPGLPSRPPGLRALFAFGGSVTGTNILSLFSRNVDQVLIGWLWGAVPLGLYERASKLLMVPMMNVCTPFYSIGMPMLSRLAEQQDRYRRAFHEMMEKLAMITLPTASLLVVTADWVTEVIFGSQWSAAAPLVACFGLAMAYQPSIIIISLLYMTQNRPGDLLRATLIDCALCILSIFAGLPFGATAVAASLTVTGLFIRTPMACWLATRRGPVRQRDLYAAGLPSLVVALSIAGAAAASRRFILPPHVAPVTGLMITIPAAMVLAGFVFYAMPSSRKTLQKLIRVRKLLFGGYAAPVGG